jgi:hypothetical protein
LIAAFAVKGFCYPEQPRILILLMRSLQGKSNRALLSAAAASAYCGAIDRPQSRLGPAYGAGLAGDFSHLQSLMCELAARPGIVLALNVGLSTLCFRSRFG